MGLHFIYCLQAFTRHVVECCQGEEIIYFSWPLLDANNEVFLSIFGLLSCCGRFTETKHMIMDDSTYLLPNPDHNVLLLHHQFWKRLRFSLQFNNRVGCHQLLYRIHFVTWYTAIKKRWFLLQKNRKIKFVMANIISWSARLLNLLNILVWYKCRTNVVWSTSNSSATSPVVLRGYASRMAFNWSLSII